MNYQDNKVLFFVGGAILLALLPLVAQHFGNAWVRIIDIALLYVLLALGLNIVVGYAGLLDLGYVAFYAVGAYMFGLLASLAADRHLRRHHARSSRTACTRRGGWSSRSGRCSPGSSACCWARRRSSCAATTWPSSRSASARSCACS